MDNVIMQSLTWIGGGIALIAYLSRRRKRKMSM